MKETRKRGGFIRIVAALIVSVVPVACGANVQAVYEGDVRFEHCMALDATVEIKPRIRRACWSEWIAFYTYGQTRDRVGHAQRRVRQLSGVSDFLSSRVPGTNAADPEPEPNNVQDLVEPSGEACTGACQSVLDDCARECSSHDCHKSCTAGFRSCVRSCG